MKKTRIWMRNDFHKTSTWFLGEKGCNSLEPRTVRRIEKRLCGVDGCSCSGDLGVRGEQKDIGRIEVFSDGHVEVYVL